MVRELDLMTETFRRRFPRSEGWTVYASWPRHMSALTSQLHNFLREVEPGWLVNPAIVESGNIHFNYYDANGLTVPPDKIVSEMDHGGWVGEMELKVEGEPLVIKNFLIQTDRGMGIMTLYASKAEKTMHTLYTRLIRWDEGRKDRNGHIMVFEGGFGGTRKRRPNATWDDVILPDGMAAEIRANIEGFFKSGPLYKEMGIPHKRGFLLAGPPGNGKTLMAKVMAADRTLNFCWLKLTNKLEDEHISSAFDYAYRHSPCIFLIEDLDRLTKNGGVTMSNILNQLDGMASGEGVLVMATTNAPEKLDPALVHRPSRFDRVWRIPLPGEEQRLAMLRKKGGKFFSEAAMARAAAAAGGFSMAYTQEIITNALILAANQGLRPADEQLDKSLAQIKSQYKKTFAREGLGREEEKAQHMGFAVAEANV